MRVFGCSLFEQWGTDQFRGNGMGKQKLKDLAESVDQLDHCEAEAVAALMRLHQKDEPSIRRWIGAGGATHKQYLKIMDIHFRTAERDGYRFPVYTDSHPSDFISYRVGDAYMLGGASQGTSVRAMRPVTIKSLMYEPDSNGHDCVVTFADGVSVYAKCADLTPVPKQPAESTILVPAKNPVVGGQYYVMNEGKALKADIHRASRDGSVVVWLHMDGIKSLRTITANALWEKKQ
jgi:hypothetical protein